MSDVSNRADPLPKPSVEVQKASLELRAALTLEVENEAYVGFIEDFRDAELAWLRSRQVQSFDRVHALVGEQRAEAARNGRISPILLDDIYLMRALILAEPELATGLRSGGVPDTVARLLEHSRIQTRTSMAILDSQLRQLEERLRDPELTSTDGHLSLLETEMLALEEKVVDVHMQRLRILPWIFQLIVEPDGLNLFIDPAVKGWLLSHGAEDDDSL